MIGSSNLSFEKPNYRQAGKRVSGHVTKGFISDPLSKPHSGSIPAKYETVLLKQLKPKGFGHITPRFNPSDEYAPGPGTYSSMMNESFSSNSRPSYSKKGFGNGFVSRSSRLLEHPYLNMGPGPGQYQIKYKDTSFKYPHIRPSSVAFSTAINSDTSLDNKDESQLGPGYYDVDSSILSTSSRTRSVSWIFKTKSSRENNNISANSPPIGYYEVDRNLIQKKTYKEPVYTSNFMKPIKKRVNSEKEKKRLVNQLLDITEEKSSVPGPGYYFSNDETDELSMLHQRFKDKQLSSFIVNNHTRFGEIVQRKAAKLDLPGPGTYVKVELDREKQLVSGAVFMSEVPRKAFEERKSILGPNRYNPESVPKKSYHLNINRKWM